MEVKYKDEAAHLRVEETTLALGPMHAASWQSDPKHLAFVLARYHFVARMLIGKKQVLEVGCGEGTGARIVQQAVGVWYGVDKNVDLLPVGSPFFRHDIIQGPFWLQPRGNSFVPWDAVYALDVLEHIAPKDQDKFFNNINQTLGEHGVVIIGSPSLESQRYASHESRKHHVNCRTEESLFGLLHGHYHNIFQFGMNDTTLHTGFGPMVHYRLAICTEKR